MGESEKAINKAEEAFGKTMNLKNYTDALVEAYEATGKIDNESFSQWVDGVREYAETTGDLEPMEFLFKNEKVTKELASFMNDLAYKGLL